MRGEGNLNTTLNSKSHLHKLLSFTPATAFRQPLEQQQQLQKIKEHDMQIEVIGIGTFEYSVVCGNHTLTEGSLIYLNQKDYVIENIYLMVEGKIRINVREC